MPFTQLSIDRKVAQSMTGKWLNGPNINKLVPKVINEENLPEWNKDRDLMDFLNLLK